MGKLIYSAITSLDGYSVDAAGSFDWAVPGDEVHAFVNALEGPIGTYLYGRLLYEVMAAWETPEKFPSGSPLMTEYSEIWQAADKIVYSTTLQTVKSAKTRIERDFDPEVIRRLTASSQADLTVGGSELAAHALRAGLVDECHLFVNPVLVGGGKRALPDALFVELELLDEHRFTNGVMHLNYRIK